MTAPTWATELAEETIRERDVLPCALWPPTPREEDGSRDDLLYWIRAVERFCGAVENGWVRNQDFVFWRGTLSSISVVDVCLQELLPTALRNRRLRRESEREHARAQAAKRKELALAKAIPAVPADVRMFGMLFEPER
jgi:hypothetical protein